MSVISLPPCLIVDSLDKPERASNPFALRLSLTLYIPSAHRFSDIKRKKTLLTVDAKKNAPPQW